nr:MAG TPA: hypothetical protein [Caudoviricetes sp.]
MLLSSLSCLSFLIFLYSSMCYNHSNKKIYLQGGILWHL